jgi:hypothetical protein
MVTSTIGKIYQNLIQKAVPVDSLGRPNCHFFDEAIWPAKDADDLINSLPSLNVNQILSPKNK